MGKETISRKTIAKSVVSGVVALASLGALQVGEYKLPAEPAETEASSETGAAAGSETEAAAVETEAGSGSVSASNGFVPGTYTASATGMESDVTAVCTFDETSLTAVELDVSGETQGIGAAAGEELTSAFLAAQSAEIDGVSGASVTSTAAKTAVADCFAQAAAGSTDEDNAAESANETETAETEAETGAAEEATANTAGSAGAYTPGTYTASAKGLESDVTAVCTFDETGLTAISLDVSGETPDIGGAIGEEMTAAILNAQSAEVDGVSGATVTSTAVKTAVSECYALAAGNTDAAEDSEASADAEENGTETAVEEESASETGAETPAVEDSETETDAEESASETEIESDAAEASAVAGSYTPGTYTASAAGISSDVTVTITFDEGNITDMTVDVSGETAGIGADIGDTMIEQVLDAQSAEVDGVSGATVTSTAVMTAVSDCLAQAAGGSDTVVDNEASTDAENETADTEENETETAVDEESSSETDAETAAADDSESETAADEEPATETEIETDAAEEASAAADSYTSGTYTASAAGISSDVTVTITFDESGITDMTVDVSGETAGIGADIGDTIIEQVLAAQSAEVDGVSGATVTSTAVMTAVSDCLAQAAGGSGTVEDNEASTDAETDTESTEENESETDAEEIETDAAEVSAAAGSYTPGTYTASASSSVGDVTAFCTFNDTSLIAIGLDVPGGIADTLSRAILHAQSAEVDSVSGAPEASAAVMEAVQSCFDQAAAGN